MDFGDVDRITPPTRSEDPPYGLEYARPRQPHPLLDGIAVGPRVCMPISCTRTISSRPKPSDLVARADYGRAGDRDRCRDTVVGRNSIRRKVNGWGCA